MLPPPRVSRSEWVKDAACAGEDPSRFVEPSRTEQRVVIERFCRRCEVREECLEEGLDLDQGVWGGTTASQRKRLRRKQARLPDASLIEMLEAGEAA